MERERAALSPKWENHREEEEGQRRFQPGSGGKCKLRQREDCGRDLGDSFRKIGGKTVDRNCF